MSLILINICVILIGLGNALIQPVLHQPYYLVNYNPQILPGISHNPMSTYGLIDTELARIVSNNVRPPNRAQAQLKIPSLINDVRALTNLTMCYYVGNDVIDSHLLFNDRWFFNDRNYEGLNTYLNDLTLATNLFLGVQNYKLKWKGPYQRSDRDSRYPERMSQDTLKTVPLGCDAVLFLVFNNYTAAQTTNGHKYSGFVEGGPCDNTLGRGYAVIVDQGFYDDIWMGPQILAHHLLLMLTVDLWEGSKPLENRFCPKDESLLSPNIKPGKQSVDQCVLNKLNRSNVSIRQCLRDV